LAKRRGGGVKKENQGISLQVGNEGGTNEQSKKENGHRAGENGEGTQKVAKKHVRGGGGGGLRKNYVDLMEVERHEPVRASASQKRTILCFRAQSGVFEKRGAGDKRGKGGTDRGKN